MEEGGRGRGGSEGGRGRGVRNYHAKSEREAVAPVLCGRCKMRLQAQSKPSWKRSGETTGKGLWHGRQSYAEACSALALPPVVRVGLRAAAGPFFVPGLPGYSLGVGVDCRSMKRRAGQNVYSMDAQSQLVHQCCGLLVLLCARELISLHTSLAYWKGRSEVTRHPRLAIM